MKFALLSLLMMGCSPLMAQQAEMPVVSMIEEPDHCFLSVLPRPVRIDIKTSKGTAGQHLGQGDILCANGELMTVQIRFHSHRVLRYGQADLRSLVALAHVDTTQSPGGWLITRRGLEYVSNDRYQRSRTDG